MGASARSRLARGLPGQTARIDLFPRQRIVNDETDLVVDPRTLHEAAHAVAAVDQMMLGISVQLMPRRSERGIQTSADTAYFCPHLFAEPLWQLLQRRLTVVLAGPAWEAHSAGEDDDCAPALQRETDDRLAAKKIIRELYRAGIRGSSLKQCVRDSWKIARTLPTSRSAQIMAICDALQKYSALDDAQIRMFYAMSSITG